MSAHKNSVPAPGLAAAGPEQSAEAAAPASSNAPAASEAPAATPLEPMSAFFAARVSGYDAHMLEDVPGLPGGVRKDGGARRYACKKRFHFAAAPA